MQLTRAIARALEELADSAYSTAAQLETASRLGDLAAGDRLAELLVESFASGFPTEPDLADHDELSRFAGWLVLVAGSRPARSARALRLTPAYRPAIEHLRAVLGLANRLPAGDALLGQRLAAGIEPGAGPEELDLEGEEALWQALASLSVARSPVATALATLLAAIGEPASALLAARAIEAPLDAEAIKVAVGWVSGRQGRIPGFPGNWPAVTAYATLPDGYGSQTVFVIRRRLRPPAARPGQGCKGSRQAGARDAGDGLLALIGVIVSSVRGIADAIVDRQLEEAELPDLLDSLRQAHGSLFEIPLGYAIGRVQEGVALARDLGIPLPLEFLLQRDLLAGLWDEGRPEIPSETWARDDLAGQTGEILEQPAVSSWFLTEADGRAVQDFVRQTAAAMHGNRSRRGIEAIVAAAIDRHADAVMAGRERLFADRLAHAAYLFDAAHQGQLRDLAATASRLLLSDAPKASQAFVRALLGASFAESEYGWLVDR